MQNYRLFLLYALFVVLFLLWDAWRADYGPISIFPQPQQPAVSKKDTSPAVPKPPEDISPAVPQPPEVEPPKPPKITRKDVSPAQKDQTITVKTDVLAVKIGMANGTLYKAKLLNYSVSVDKPDKKVRLLHRASPDLFVAQSGVRTTSNPAAFRKAVHFSSPKTHYELAPGEERLVVPLTWTGKNGLTITKTYIFRRNSYRIGLQIKVENKTEEVWTGRAYAQFSRTPPESGGFLSSRFYVGAAFSTKEEQYNQVAFDDLSSEPFSQHSPDGWVAMQQHYFVAAWIPREQGTHYYYGKHIQRSAGSHYVVGVMLPEATVTPGDKTVFQFTLFAGPKLQERLAATAPNLALTIDYGIWTVIAKPLFWLLSWFHSLVGNWGWAIVLLTITVKLAFFKLSQTSYRSMARMRKLQPQLKALKERYGNDRHKVGPAMVELYRKEKVNPLGGCLPILVQMPVFIALYVMLIESVELRQAPFILWIEDLTVKDPYYVLPILMGVSMLVQQKISPTPADPVQARMMSFMPIAFTIFFSFFPAGLVLYWVVSNMISIAQQWYITHRMESES